LLTLSCHAVSGAIKPTIDRPDRREEKWLDANDPNQRELLAIKPVDEGVFSLPPLPIADYRLLTTNKGIWNRADSVVEMTKTPPNGGLGPIVNGLAEPCQGLIPLPGIHANCSSSNGKQPYPLGAVVDGEASVVLYISGLGLERAVLMFDTTQIREVPLSAAGGRPPGKAGDNFALLVMDTTRGNPDWRDIDTSVEYSALKSKFPKADGAFYVLVRDAFGRNTRFDIEYHDWGSRTYRYQQVCRTNASHAWRNSWWDPTSPGVTVTGDKNFSLNMLEATITQFDQDGNGNCGR
jgi:hypothetical protein